MTDRPRDNDDDDDDLDHVVRDTLPWRTGPPLTECGHHVAAPLTWDEFAAKVKRLGQQRAAMTTCMTCWSAVTMRSYQTDRPLIAMMEREVARVTRSRVPDHRDRLERELRAIAALVDAHRDEFDAAVGADLPDLAVARRARRDRQRAAGGGVR